MDSSKLEESPVVVLMGAGASVEAGLPTAAGLTSEALGIPDQCSELTKIKRLLYRAVVGGTLFSDAQRGEDPLNASVNVEDLAEGLSLLANHRWSKFGTLFGGIEDHISALESEYRATSGSGKTEENLLTLVGENEKERKSAAKKLATKIAARKNEIYPGLYSSALIELKRLTIERVRIETRSFQYLEPLVACQRVTAIGSLNFDTLVEQTCSKVGRSYDVGVFAWKRQGIKVRAGHLPVLKLHGSTDWRSVYGISAECDEPPPKGQRMQRIEHAMPQIGGFVDTSCVLFGERNKLRAAGPFLDLLRSFEVELRKVHQLAVIGYSFADRHINDVIDAWLRRRTQNEVFIANGPDWLKSVEDDDSFMAVWDTDQVHVTQLRASEAVKEWFGE